MEKKQILINDFNLFCDLMKSVVKIVDSAKLLISENGLAIYGARKPIARCEITTNAIYANEKIEVCILDLQMFVKVLSTVREIHENDYSDFKLFIANEKICFESKKFKSKFQTQKESIIAQWISQAITTKMNPVFEFTTTNDLIKRVRNHQFIFTTPETMRIYLETKDDMENNTLFATLGNKQAALTNEMTLKFGLITFGSIKDKNIILDIDRLNLFDSVQAKDIKISLMDANILVSNVRVEGKNDSYFNVKIYSGFLKS